MTHTRVLRQSINLPFHPAEDFDHGNVFLSTGFVFIANTASGTVEVYVAIGNPGEISVVNTSAMIVEEQIQTEVGAHTRADDSQRQHRYVFLPSWCVAAYSESEEG